jgi:hypothetical protein
MLSIQCSLRREDTRDHSKTQRPVCRREYIPVGLLAVLRILARRNNGDERSITFGPEQGGDR